MYSAAASHYEEARPLDAASEAKLMVVQETFLEHSHWPHQYRKEDDPTHMDGKHNETDKQSQKVGDERRDTLDSDKDMN